MPFRVASVLCASALLGSTSAAPDDASVLYQYVIGLRRGRDAQATGGHDDVEAGAHGVGTTKATRKAEGPITDVPWAQLDKHRVALASMNKVLNSVISPLMQFLTNCSHEKNLLRAGIMEEGRTVGELARSLEAALTSTKSRWFGVARGIISSFNFSDSEELRSQEDVMDIVYQIVEEVDRLTKHVNWFIDTGVRVVPPLANSSMKLVPAELGVLKAATSEFSQQRDASVNVINDALQDLTAHLGQQVTDPIAETGAGTCLDAGGQQYQTFEKLGCESRFYCMSGCRKYSRDQCRGVTFSKLANGCGRCELRMERGLAESKDGWAPEWTEATGAGPIANTSNATAADGLRVTCYRREVPEWDSWPALMRQTLNKELEKREAGYYIVARLWRSGLFKIDRAFWQIESGIAETSAKILQLRTLSTA